MIKILKIMLNDIFPKNFKSFFEGITVITILMAILKATAFLLFATAFGIAWLFTIPIDLAILIVMGVIFIGLWINSAYERSN
jgi:hypothetical protein